MPYEVDDKRASDNGQHAGSGQHRQRLVLAYARGAVNAADYIPDDLAGHPVKSRTGRHAVDGRGHSGRRLGRHAYR